ncbi:hypothetical protein L596_028402 [Steinernema carpocapsae]|uniref:Uncharacterized protein n=1 Tax=Steinernema carpocapsae TaxID=34508 RepID=A0A4U5LYB4_STECR|nr:hypothetical protein L596_028402 [Steinernema carpocapsae]
MLRIPLYGWIRNPRTTSAQRRSRRYGDSRPRRISATGNLLRRPKRTTLRKEADPAKRRRCCQDPLTRKRCRKKTQVDGASSDQADFTTQDPSGNHGLEGPSIVAAKPGIQRTPTEGSTTPKEVAQKAESTAVPVDQDSTLHSNGATSPVIGRTCGQDSRIPGNGGRIGRLQITPSPTAKTEGFLRRISQDSRPQMPIKGIGQKGTRKIHICAETNASDHGALGSKTPLTAATTPESRRISAEGSKILTEAGRIGAQEGLDSTSRVDQVSKGRLDAAANTGSRFHRSPTTRKRCLNNLNVI